MMNKKTMYKELAFGFIVALIATAFGCYIFIEFFSNFDFNRSLELIQEGKLYGKVLVLGALANFFVFFVFVKKKQIYRARGVLLETIIIALFVMIYTLFFKN